jgi:peptidoglycan/LPS O-acetylase OafA/YrhL
VKPPEHGFAYRPALDGLRAVAVLAVIGYHLGYRQLQGGFVGVDLFFVLSGYLITSLLLVEYRSRGAIDLPQFWLRRARRLLPALFLVLAAISVWVHGSTPAFELALRKRDLLWTLFYGSNWHLIASAQDYFAQSASVSPVRHTWSLAIEEQFYLVWPLVVLAALRFGRGRLRLLALAGGVGVVTSALAMAVLFTPFDPSRAYYGTDSRIHQPLIGALLAILVVSEIPSALRRMMRALSAVGAVVLVATFLLLNDHQPIYWHGLSTAIALAAAAVIAGLETNPSGGLATGLSRRPLPWIGQISYGLYLWHWPAILAVAAPPWFLRSLPGSTGINLTRVALTFAVATVSFYLLEQPLRRGTLPILRASVPRFIAATAVSTVLVVAVILRATRGATDDIAAQDIPGCPASGDTVCVRFEAPTNRPVVALIGDSIARSLDPAFMALAREHSWTYLLAAKNACRVTHLLTSYEGEVPFWHRQCYETTPRVLRRVLRWKPAVIVAMDRWEIMDFVGADGRVQPRGTPEHIQLTEQALVEVSRELTSSGARLAFVELPPVVNAECGKTVPLSSPKCNVRVADDIAQAPYNALFERLPSAVPGTSRLSITRVVCPDGVCTPRVGDLLIRFDGLHFTPAASTSLAPTLWQEMKASRLLDD